MTTTTKTPTETRVSLDGFLIVFPTAPLEAIIATVGEVGITADTLDALDNLDAWEWETGHSPANYDTDELLAYVIERAETSV